ncbi:unnamed protein product [Protopolystoma xenopodis]|uniref:Uncharacterized protein n=1 Tax=Protopolystoma xenopodis TaxID=117903 RepID=A0A3S5AYL1_9PLAT|nr:unnamed protein product [Protopolystoma xenopodis]
MQNFLAGLTPGQTAWICELAVRSMQLPRQLLVQLTLNPDAISTSAIKNSNLDSGSEEPAIFYLAYLGLAEELVLCHDSMTRRNVSRTIFFSDSSFTPITALSGSKQTPSKDDSRRILLLPRLFPKIEALRCYLGDSVGIYFQWMKSYSLALTLPAVLSLLLSAFVSYMVSFSGPSF